MNTKADILSRKDQVNTKEDNKDVQLLKDEMWSRKIVGKIWVFDDRKVVEETDIIKRIKKNGTREKEVLQALQKKDVKNIDDGLQFLFFLSYFIYFSFSFSIFRTRVRV